MHSVPPNGLPRIPSGVPILGQTAIPVPVVTVSTVGDGVQIQIAEGHSMIEARDCLRRGYDFLQQKILAQEVAQALAVMSRAAADATAASVVVGPQGEA